MLQQKQGSWCGCTQPMRNNVQWNVVSLAGHIHKMIRAESCWGESLLVGKPLMLVCTELPRDLGLTSDQKMAKLAVTLELVGKVVCSSYVTHQKVISYCWILTITWAYSPLKSTISMTAFNRQKRSWNLSNSLASDPTRSWILLRSQVFADWS